MKAIEIAQTNIVTVRGSATVAEAVQLMKDKQVRALVVERRSDDDAYGIVTETDVAYKVIAFGKDPKSMRVYEIMSKPCIVVNPDLCVEYVARLFANTGIHLAPVIKDKLLGTISISDILEKSNFIEAPRSVLLQDRIQKAIEEARAVCADKGPRSKECAAAWDVVEELQAEAAHQKAERLTKTAFEEYCEEYPDAPEARVYDN
ncbi:CP12 domain-containing protein [Baaleninema sp.]|uniref:CP12 domain-containing protein n=1 Tax=Baaleninema sp. TaxID=3101197 RepID=UPI003D022777